MEMIKPEDCIKYDVCKFANDAGCFDGCDYRIERAPNVQQTVTGSQETLTQIREDMMDISEKLALVSNRIATLEIRLRGLRLL